MMGSVSLSPEDERIGRYLRGETLLLEPGEATREKGWILVCVDQYALGWGKLVNGVLKNKLLERLATKIVDIIRTLMRKFAKLY